MEGVSIQGYTLVDSHCDATDNMRLKPGKNQHEDDQVVFFGQLLSRCFHTVLNVRLSPLLSDPSQCRGSAAFPQATYNILADVKKASACQRDPVLSPSERSPEDVRVQYSMMCLKDDACLAPYLCRDRISTDIRVSHDQDGEFGKSIRRGCL
jgi:hypothetical protein